MESLAFDTHRFVKNLTSAGMPEAQAEVLANEQVRLIEANLATKRDIAEVKQDIAALNRETVEIKQEIAKLNRETAEIKQEIVELKREIAEIKQDIGELKREIAEIKREIAEIKQDIFGLKRDIAEIKHDMRFVEQRLTIRLGALMASGILILAAMIGFF